MLFWPANCILCIQLLVILFKCVKYLSICFQNIVSSRSENLMSFYSPVKQKITTPSNIIRILSQRTVICVPTFPQPNLFLLQSVIYNMWKKPQKDKVIFCCDMFCSVGSGFGLCASLLKLDIYCCFIAFKDALPNFVLTHISTTKSSHFLPVYCCETHHNLQLSFKTSAIN